MPKDTGDVRTGRASFSLLRSLPELFQTLPAQASGGSANDTYVRGREISDTIGWNQNVVLIFILIGLLACTAGSLCGIGGGIIIKPVLDLSGLMPVESASFLSGCTVLAMTAFSVGRTFLEGNRAIDVVRGTPLAAGAGIGGVAGQFLFSQIAGTASDTDALGNGSDMEFYFCHPWDAGFIHYLSIR